MTQTIRTINKNDLKVLAKIYSQAYNSLDVGENWSTEASYKLLDYLLNRKPSIAFLAESDNKIIGGIIAAVKPWWDGNHLVDGEFFVNPQHQGKGIGKKLMLKLCETAIKEYNITCLDATTFRNKNFPLNWYKSLGFREVKEWVIISANPKEILESLK